MRDHLRLERQLAEAPDASRLGAAGADRARARFRSPSSPGARKPKPSIRRRRPSSSATRRCEQREIAENSLADTNGALKTVQAGARCAASGSIRRARRKSRRRLPPRARKPVGRDPNAIEKLRAERDGALQKPSAGSARTAPRADAAPSADPRRGAAPPPVRPSQEEADIIRVLRQYEAAYGARNVDAVQRVRILAAADAKALRATFARYARIPPQPRQARRQRLGRPSPGGRDGEHGSRWSRLAAAGGAARRSAILPSKNGGPAWLIVDVR